MKRPFPIFAGIIIICLCLYFAGSEILTGLSESIIRKNLPDYLRIGQVNVDNRKGEFNITDIRVINPSGYEDPYFFTAERLTASFRANILTISRAFEVTRIEMSGITINIERQRGGGINIADMRNVMRGESSFPEFEEMEPVTRRAVWSGSGYSENNGDRVLAALRNMKAHAVAMVGRKASKARNLVKLTDNIVITDGDLKFKDRAIRIKPVMIELDYISGEIGILLNDDMTRIEKISSKGSGSIKGTPGQYLKWDISADLAAQRPTMDNKLILSGVDLILIKPYYDRFFPIDVKNGYISGSFIFNLDNGAIGSDNILTVKDLIFENKPDDSSLLFWSEDIGALVEYLRTAEGETLFDFKIKGDIENPKFYPGPEVKKAIGRLTMDRIRDFVDRAFHKSDSGK